MKIGFFAQFFRDSIGIWIADPLIVEFLEKSRSPKIDREDMPNLLVLSSGGVQNLSKGPFSTEKG